MVGFAVLRVKKGTYRLNLHLLKLGSSLSSPFITCIYCCGDTVGMIGEINSIVSILMVEMEITAGNRSALRFGISVALLCW